MMYATKIRMNRGANSPFYCTDIDSIYLEGAKEERFYEKGVLHDFIEKNPDSIRVKLGEQPYLIPAISSRGEKYVRSEPNDTTNDNLLKLPKG